MGFKHCKHSRIMIFLIFLAIFHLKLVVPTSLLGDTEHAFLLNEVRNNNVATLSRERTKDERRIYDLNPWWHH